MERRHKLTLIRFLPDVSVPKIITKSSASYPNIEFITTFRFLPISITGNSGRRNFKPASCGILDYGETSVENEYAKKNTHFGYFRVWE